MRSGGTGGAVRSTTSTGGDVEMEVVEEVEEDSTSNVEMGRNGRGSGSGIYRLSYIPVREVLRFEKLGM